MQTKGRKRVFAEVQPVFANFRLQSYVKSVKIATLALN